LDLVNAERHSSLLTVPPTDDSFGDMLWGHSYKTEVPLVIDIVADIRRLNDLSMRAKKAGCVQTPNRQFHTFRPSPSSLSFLSLSNSLSDD
jgi:hypothetical protein